MRSFQSVENKIKESDFFLGCLESTKGPEIFYYLSAYLSAARSITFAIQVAMKGLADFEKWYKQQQQRLKEDPVALYLLEVRNYILHEGEYPIRTLLFVSPHSLGGFFFTPIPGKEQLETPSGEVSETCRQYMITILKIIRECFQRFGYIIDPVLRFNHVISSRQKTIEDIEEELGFPRGWTKIEGMSDENRAKVLQSELKKDTIHIDDIFNKYLGTDRLGNLV
ncbi:hypothetical protein [Alistipes communis]|uniref:hypothetical protein n=1 Tax=Alistipes communis TaxID=2585118 RepID=UPI0022E972EB|nr:hypothetical protein [Alistipes communis]